MAHARPSRDAFRSLFSMGPVQEPYSREELQEAYDLAIIDLQQSHGYSPEQAQRHLLGYIPADYEPADTTEQG